VPEPEPLPLVNIEVDISPPPPAQVNPVGSDLKNQGKKKIGSGSIDRAITDLVKTQFRQKFGQDIPDPEINRLIMGDRHFPGFQNQSALIYAISKIGGKPDDPVAVLVKFAQEPGEYLKKNAEYDEFKRLLRNPDRPAP
jgi:hypothetical protein